MGSTENRKRFYHLVNKITTQSYGECVYRTSLHKGYDIKAMKWLQDMKLSSKKESRKLLQKTNRYLISYIVKPLIKYFYQPIRSLKSYEINFVPKCLWHSFKDKAFNKLVQQEHLILSEVGLTQDVRGVLKIMPKSSCDSLNYRTYVVYNKKNHLEKVYFKKLSEAINKEAKMLNISNTKPVYNAWNTYMEVMFLEKLFGIKIDIQDAFGNVDINSLCEIIEKYNIEDKAFIVDRIKNQYVTYKNNVYKWNHGLLQGDPLSSSLCNLYIGDFEFRHLRDFVQPHNFLHRVVDDYLFCSSKLKEVQEFEKLLTKLFPINDAKTEKVVCSNNVKLTYCGQIFNLASREVGRFFECEKKGTSLQYKFKIWNIKKPIPEKNFNLFIVTCMHFKTTNFNFKAMELNTRFNGENKVLYNYFEGMVFVAYKFHIVMKSLIPYGQTADNISNLYFIVRSLVFSYAKISLGKIVSNKGRYYSGRITVNLLFKIGIMAFLLTLKKYNEFYKELVKKMSSKKLYLNFDGFTVDHSLFRKIPESLRYLTTKKFIKI